MTSKKKEKVVAPSYGPTSPVQKVLWDDQDTDLIIYGGGAGCYDYETEYLTPSGWKRFDKYVNGDEVAQYNPQTHQIEFVKPEDYIVLPCDKFYRLEDTNYDMVLSIEHRIPYWSGTGWDKLRITTMRDVLSLYNKGLYQKGKVKTTFKIEDDTDLPTLGMSQFYDLRNKLLMLDEKITYKGWAKMTTSQAEEIMMAVINRKDENTEYSLSAVTNHKENADIYQFVMASFGYATHIRDYGKYYRVHAYCNSDTIRFRGDIKPQEYQSKDGKKYCFTVPSGLLLVRRSNKIFVSGNSGKTMTTMLKMLQYIDCPNFEAVFIRESHTQLEQSGGLWSEMKKLYPKFGARYTARPKRFTFKSGATISLMSCGTDADVSNFDGGQYSVIVFDEAQNHSFEQFSYLGSRNRSSSKYKSRMILTCNPMKGSWLLDFVSWYIDDVSGIPIPEKANTVRWYIVLAGKVVTADTPEELIEKYGQDREVKPMSYRFIPATIYDNPLIIKNRPEYLTYLQNLKTNERNRLLLGSWFAIDEGDGYFKAEWVKKVPDIPPDVRILNTVRAWDFACTLESETNRDPDYTATVKMCKCSDGKYYIVHADRFRARQHDVESAVIKYAHEDGIYDCITVIPRDPGVSGKNYAMSLRRKIAETGAAARESAVVPTKSKLSRFLPFAVTAEAGDICIVEADWNGYFLEELESFRGERKRGVHDDLVDTVADAFNNINRTTKITSMVIPSFQQVRNIRKT